MKIQLTRESIIQSVKDGAKSLTVIAHRHNYQGSVSSGTTKTIRQLVPDIADLLAGKEVQALVTVPVVQPVEQSVVQPEEKPVVVKIVRQRVENVKPSPHSPYRGKVYGPIFNEALASGKMESHAFYAQTAAKLGLTNLQVFYAVQVLNNPKHPSNNGRSRNVSGHRGYVQIEAVAAVERVSEVEEVADVAEVAAG